MSPMDSIPQIRPGSPTGVLTQESGRTKGKDHRLRPALLQSGVKPPHSKEGAQARVRANASALQEKAEEKNTG